MKVWIPFLASCESLKVMINLKIIIHIVNKCTQSGVFEPVNEKTVCGKYLLI